MFTFFSFIFSETCITFGLCIYITFFASEGIPNSMFYTAFISRSNPIPKIHVPAICSTITNPKKVHNGFLKVLLNLHILRFSCQKNIYISLNMMKYISTLKPSLSVHPLPQASIIF